MIRLAIGYDYREAVAYHTFVQSIIEKATMPVTVLPLARNLISNYSDLATDGSNQFIISRFLTPSLANFEGWFIYVDGDLICNDDVATLWEMRDENYAVQCVKHDYKTKFENKYFGNKNENYPRKNWSSVIMWNCAHPSNRVLTPEFVSQHDGKYLHRFSWLNDHEIGELPIRWNWLSTEYEDNPDAGFIHYTLGTPCFEDWSECGMSDYWHNAFRRSVRGFDYEQKLTPSESTDNS